MTTASASFPPRDPALNPWLARCMEARSFGEGMALAAEAVERGAAAEDALPSGEPPIRALAVRGAHAWAAGLARLLSEAGRSDPADLARALWACCSQPGEESEACASALLALGASPTAHRQRHACVSSPRGDGTVDSLGLAAWAGRPKLLAALADAAVLADGLALACSAPRASLADAAAIADACLSFSFMRREGPLAEAHRACSAIARRASAGLPLAPPEPTSLPGLFGSARAHAKAIHAALEHSRPKPAPSRARPAAERGPRASPPLPQKPRSPK